MSAEQEFLWAIELVNEGRDARRILKVEAADVAMQRRLNRLFHPPVTISRPPLKPRRIPWAVKARP